jgi:hypothetical protein
MFPNKAVTNVEYSALTDSELFSNTIVTNACRNKSAYLTNGIRSKAGVMVRRTNRATTVSGTPLLAHVAHVVCLCADEQMRRVAAWRVIAMMQDMQSFGDRSVVQFPRKAVRHVESAPSMSSDAQPTVSCRVRTASPKPAGVGFLNLFPKAVGKWADGSDEMPSGGGARVRTEPISTGGVPEDKGFVASFAGPHDRITGDTGKIAGTIAEAIRATWLDGKWFAALLTGNCDTIGAHTKPQLSCVMPPVVPATRGRRVSFIIPRLPRWDAVNHP